MTQRVTEQMRQAFYSKAEVLSTGTVLNLDVALEAALSASPTSASVAVKPLEWLRAGRTTQDASTIVGWYTVERRGVENPEWYWKFQGKTLTKVGSEEEAKAAAQTDFETRIRSALAT